MIGGMFGTWPMTVVICTEMFHDCVVTECVISVINGFEPTKILVFM